MGMYLKDHLGNVRKVIGETGAVVQETEYFAFGLAIPKTAGTNKYLYNGKEKQPETEYFDYGWRQYDAGIGRWFGVDPVSDWAGGLTPYRYGFNNPINYVDLLGLWEITRDGYATSDPTEIQQFLSYFQYESQGLKSTPSISQITSMIREVRNGNLPTNSNGGKLLTGIDFSGYTHGSRTNWYAKQSTVERTWHEVQGSLTPDALDPRTLYNNFLGTTYAGPDNPKTYSGKDDYSFIPPNWVELPAIIHDKAYDELKINGKEGLFNDTRAIKADYTFVLQTYGAVRLEANPWHKLQGILIGTGLGSLALPKTVRHFSNKALKAFEPLKQAINPNGTGIVPQL